MSFTTMQQQLLNVFRQNNFQRVWEDGEAQKEANRGRNPAINTIQYQVPNNFNQSLTINYPGYKTKKNYNGYIVYDYRVDLNNIPISHANIIVDLYNKARQLPNVNSLRNLLFDLARNGNDIDLNNHLELLNFQFAPPSEELLNSVTMIHNQIGKQYQIDGNLNWNYSIQQLCALIMWIVLQEDINYPMRFRPLQGRRMSFYRYIEALYCAENPEDNEHTIAHVIERALHHGIPGAWHNININYQPIIDLGPENNREYD